MTETMFSAVLPSAAFAATPACAWHWWADSPAARLHRL
jgi:hypothetical protein